MTIESIPGTTERYYLVTFDADGSERNDDSDGRMSEVVLQAIASNQPSDIFFFIHGWKGDIQAAKEQYGSWMGTMLGVVADRARAERLRPGFKPMLIGLHWPSLPFGQESFEGAASFDLAATDDLDAAVELCAAQTAESKLAREALRVIFEAAENDPTPPALPQSVRDAYETLNGELGLGSDGASGAPGSDREVFDPDAAYASALEEPASFGGGIVGGLLSPLVQLSFWKMKDRARKFGENGGFAFLKAVMEAGEGRDVRLHLMGHSFGCIAASSCICGPRGGQLPGPIHSLVLVQGALSLWSFCDSIPSAPHMPGYFRRLCSNRLVAGPIATTRSTLDTAVGSLYPIAAGLARQVEFAPGTLPKYGGLGAFGIQGSGLDLSDMDALSVKETYGFKPGHIYNIECSKYICDGGPPSGAHNDISKPEVAHIVWSAAN